MKLKLVCQILIAVIGFSLWGLFAYIDPSNRPDFLKFCIVMATGPILLALRDMQGSSSVPTPVIPTAPTAQQIAPTTIVKD